MAKDGVALVEQLLERVGQQRWDELPPLLSADYEILEPDSLPYGGTHRGADGYIALMQRIGELFDLRFDLDRLDAVDDETIVLRMDVSFTARATAPVDLAGRGRAAHGPRWAHRPQ